MPLDTALTPLVSRSDAAEYRAGLDLFARGRWDEDRWKTFRLRFGVYAQRQTDRYMVRAKLPGGRLGFDQARAAARANGRYCGGDLHITTRQDFQFYFLDLPSTPAFLDALEQGGVTTREASGNTIRNVVACPLAGICPKQRIDAGEVAEFLSRAWLRHPLVQHMPRKFKTTVSGCEADCGASAIDDLGFIATEQDGVNGFRVVAGGGLGNRPRKAVVVADFVLAEDLAAVQEAFARLHHEHSNRANKNASRIKFLVDRFGEEGFAAAFREQFAKVRNTGALPVADIEWRTPASEGPPPSIRDGEIVQPDGRLAIVVRPPLGMIGSDRLLALTDLAEDLGAAEFRLTRDQNILVIGLPAENRSRFLSRVEALDLEAGADRDALSNLVACPGTSTCTIGITNSNALAREMREDREAFAGLPETAIRISGCHNSCGQHHIGDFGLHALAKKINGRSAPHYQFHFGGDGASRTLAETGPVVPARLAGRALKTVIAAYADGRHDGESVGDWVRRLGVETVSSLLEAYTAEGYDGQDPDLLLDVGSAKRFFPPLSASGECAAFAVVGEYLSDLAETALEDISRRRAAGDEEGAGAAAKEAISHAMRRLLLIAEVDHEGLDFEAMREAFTGAFGGHPVAMAALNGAVEKMGSDAAAEVAGWLSVAGDLAESLIPGAYPISASA